MFEIIYNKLKMVAGVCIMSYHLLSACFFFSSAFCQNRVKFFVFRSTPITRTHTIEIIFTGVVWEGGQSHMVCLSPSINRRPFLFL